MITTNEQYEGHLLDDPLKYAAQALNCLGNPLDEA